MATIQPRLAGHAKAYANRLIRSSNIRPFSSSACYADILKPRSIVKLLANDSPDPVEVSVNGFVRSVRKMKGLHFVSIGDGSTFKPIQAIIRAEDYHSNLSLGTAVRLEGRWRPSPQPLQQSHELLVSKLDVLGGADPSKYPLQKKEQSFQFLRTLPHLRARIPYYSSLLRLRSNAISELTQFLASEGMTQTHTPIITSSDCEGAGEVFNIGSAYVGKPTKNDDGSFFKSPKYLTVSSQLHLEALAQSVGDVWTLSPTFRAERSDTPRHLSEFYMLEVEMSFVQDMATVMSMVEKLIRRIAESFLGSQAGHDLLAALQAYPDSGQSASASTLLKRSEGVLSSDPWHRITYTEAIKLLEECNSAGAEALRWGAPLQIEDEKLIVHLLNSRNDRVAARPVFVTHYPKSIKPFYMASSAAESCDDREVVDCFDVLFPDVGEIVGGSMREHRLEPLITSMQSNGMVPPVPLPLLGEKDFGELNWYVDLRRWGSIPHGGFGIGFDRLLAYLSGVPNLRDIVAFPRAAGQCLS